MRRFEDSHRSALNIINIVTESGSFLPQLTQENVTENKELHLTAARYEAIQDIARATGHHEAELDALKRYHAKAVDKQNAEMAIELKPQKSKSEAMLK